MNAIVSALVRSSVALAVFVVSACGGGGGGGGGSSGALSVTLASPTSGVQPKRIGLSWTVGGDDAATITTFRALIKVSDAAPYELLTDTLSGSSGSIALPSLSALEWAQARVMVQGCTAALACTDSNEQPLLAALPGAIGYFKASNSGSGDQFGFAVALSADGNTMAIGAVGEDSAATGINGNGADNSAAGSGAAYVFFRTGASWSQQAYVKASNTGAGDAFGFSLDLSGDGNTLVVGAIAEASAAAGINGNQADNSSAGSGAAYVFVRNGAAWSQQAYLKASNTGGGDTFGFAVALSGDGASLAVGAIGEGSSIGGVGGNQADNQAPGAGAVYLYTRSGTTWTQQAYIKASNPDNADEYGYSVDLSSDGSTLAVGARFEDSAAAGIGGNQADNTLANSGAVYVYTRSGTTWSQQAYLKAASPGASDTFGASVALAAGGDTLAVGACCEDGGATGINGNQADNSVANSGAAYVFVRNGTAWTQQAYVKASNTGSGDTFGFTVALSADGDTLAVGATGEDSNAVGIGGDQTNNAVASAGAVYLYQRSAASWAQTAYVKSPNPDSDDRFGFDVALSADGLTLAATAVGEASTAAGIGGDRANNAAALAGAVYLY